ncbi:MAG TPA: hypothetical protein VHN14_31555 [Kofleriaceae bacterium]|jgi:hypothetical protein|nr:hypothetical protein [Kofleriaceae bacterium]
MTTPTSNRFSRSSYDGDTPSGGSGTPAPRSSAFFARSIVSSRTYYFDSKLKLFPGLTIPLRSMLVETSKQQVLISPVATPEEASQIDAPPVLVAPSLLHPRQIAAAVERYRPLALWGPPGLAETRPELGPVHVLGLDAWPYGDQLGFAIIEGAPRCNDVVFFHRASRTIYTANLFCHICEPEGFLAPLAFRMMGVYRRFSTAKLWRRWVTDRAAFARSIDEILTWNFDRIVVAHGEVVENDARARFEAALREVHLIE